jgi:heme/copper-type cytochrome/quinol oxidase subunit 2
MLNDDGSNPNLFRNLDVDNRVVVPTGLSTLMMITSADVLHS